MWIFTLPRVFLPGFGLSCSSLSSSSESYSGMSCCGFSSIISLFRFCENVSWKPAKWNCDSDGGLLPATLVSPNILSVGFVLAWCPLEELVRICFEVCEWGSGANRLIFVMKRCIPFEAVRYQIWTETKWYSQHPKTNQVLKQPKQETVSRTIPNKVKRKPFKSSWCLRNLDEWLRENNHGNKRITQH